MSDWKNFLISEIVEFNPKNIDKNYPFQQITYLDISSVGTGIADLNNVIELSQAPSRAKRLVNQDDLIIATVRPGNKSYFFINSNGINPPIAAPDRRTHFDEDSFPLFVCCSR